MYLPINFWVLFQFSDCDFLLEQAEYNDWRSGEEHIVENNVYRMVQILHRECRRHRVVDLTHDEYNILFLETSKIRIIYKKASLFALLAGKLYMYTIEYFVEEVVN